MKNSDLVSIIVPVYNVQEYLRDCIISILQQTYKNIEVLLVNDGSTDESGKICGEYAKKDIRIRVFHTKNAGVSVARNLGLRYAQGEYITFVDSDDSIHPQMVEMMVSELQRTNSDCIICSCKTVETMQSFENIEEFETEVVEANLAIRDLCHLEKPYKDMEVTAVWGTLYKHSIIEGFSFAENVTVGEDFLFKYSLFHSCTSITYISAPLYHYLIRPSSAMRNGFNKQKLESLSYFENFLTSANSDRNYMNLMTRIVNMAIVILFMIPIAEEYRDERIRVINYIRKYRISVLMYSATPLKVRTALILSLLVGFDTLQRIFQMRK
ncbi:MULTISPECIES: glycosyltransferase family 2 protein [Streptococcus]|uniref:glycosyltransferase family 2 protein n=1 Tax=Streptococcus TaxID=1301 RepID=UPI0037D312AB